MSVESGRAFLQIAYDSPELKQQLKAVTGTREIVRLGSRYGYSFDVPELMEASSSFAPASGESPRAVRRPAEAERDAGPLHHEYRLEDLPGLKRVIDLLPHLKIKPPSFDLDRFARTFRAEDLRSTDLSPANPEFQVWHESMMKAHWRDPALGSGAPRRDFHLVNLDEHVDHPGYDRYLEAKHRMIRTLEEFFAAEIRFSGSLWYPPSSYRLWHTNETQPGWRMYIVDFDEPFDDPADTSFFRYMNPRTEEIVTLRETPRMVRFFKAEQDPRRLFWHCIVNPTSRHRWSFGFVVPDGWMTAITRQV
ncbi:hypothetical protein GCM10023191_092570 [Actinoallomurus oryzae]|uniref:Nif11 domain-containing protein n=1 Tax=Actinoallomurus oryzae TaxID=502180 RepID=A0ABP8R5C0_9ACTN